MKAILRHSRISSKKANLIASLVRRKKALEAVDILKFTPKKGARLLKKLLESAIANAENNFKQNKNELYIKEIIVTEGPTLKRSMPISRGRTHPILKRTAHITIKLEAKKSENTKIVKTGSPTETKPEPKAVKKEPTVTVKSVKTKK